MDSGIDRHTTKLAGLLLPDDKTPCLKVMAVKKTEDLEKAIPKTLDGYPVEIEETGIIRPLTDK